MPVSRSLRIPPTFRKFLTQAKRREYLQNAWRGRKPWLCFNSARTTQFWAQTQLLLLKSKS